MMEYTGKLFFASVYNLEVCCWCVRQPETACGGAFELNQSEQGWHYFQCGGDFAPTPGPPPPPPFARIIKILQSMNGK